MYSGEKVINKTGRVLLISAKGEGKGRKGGICITR
jgi:hypothetical protein